MDSFEAFCGVAVAVGTGFIIGLQREQAADHDRKAAPPLLGGPSREAPAPPETATHHGTVGGIRTHPLFALAGALSCLVVPVLGTGVVLVVFATLMLLIAISYAGDVWTGRGRGVTSEAMFAITFLLGALCTAGGTVEPATRRWLLVAATGVVATSLLTLKRPLHRFARGISIEEMYESLKFLVLGVIVLPLLPDTPVGPLGALNPFAMGLMIVLMSTISLVGYVAMRVLGAGHGLGITGLVGGLVSSTAVTMSSSARARRDPSVATPCALAVTLASTVMVVRILIEVGAVNPGLVPTVLRPLGGMLLAGIVASAVLFVRSRGIEVREDAVELKNPFELGQAFRFGLLFAGVMILAKAAQVGWGDRGIYAAAAISGLHDVDAITLSMARMARSGLDAHAAATGILLAAVTNTAVKAALAFVLGGPALGRRASLALALMGVAGFIALVL